MTRLRTLILDASVLIDLHKAVPLDAVFAMPYAYEILSVIMQEVSEPDTGLHGELLRVLEVCENVNELRVSQSIHQRAYNAMEARGKISLNDSYLVALAENMDNSILLTGDKSLRMYAEECKVEVHGAIWVFDEICKHGNLNSATLLAALDKWSVDIAVYLPPGEIDKRIARLSKK